MSYLTQILVDYERAVRFLKIKDSYDWHQRAWEAFPGRDGQQRDFLTRIDELDEAHRLLIVSPTAPAKPNWCPDDCFQTKPIGEDFFTAERYRFSLLVNPTRKRVLRNEAGERKKNGRREAIIQRPELLTWLQRKAAAGGFDIGDPEAVRTVPKPRSYFHKPGAAPGVHYAVEFQGILRITDPALFRTTFATGIGSAKAFGFGLLALAPIQ